MKSKISIQINHQTHLIDPGLSVAAALALCGQLVTRVSVSGENRAPFCGMGVCQECRVTINQQAHQLACQTMCSEGMSIITGDAR
jgi:hypothetical protein